MSVTVTRTKIHIPRRRDDLLSRPRLTKILDDLLDYPFTLISAPAGYGKTSLMIDLAHQAQFPVCWYSIDSLDRDPLRFFTYLIHSIRVQFPHSGDNFLSLVGDLNDIPNHIDQLAATLVNDLIQGTEEHFAIFLDDFNLLENQPAINSFISQFGQQMDDNIHLVIASRGKFSIPDLPLLIGRNLVKGIDSSDLTFRAEEIKGYLENKLDQPISLEECKSLETRTEGWITGLLLFAYRGWGYLLDQGKALKVSGANIDDYFESQIFDNQAEWTQKLMLKTSLLDEFNAESCIKIFGDSGGNSWDDLVALLLENNLFVELIGDRDPWLRYHNLFKDYLQAKLAEDNNERRRLLESVYQYHLDQQDWEKAFAAARMIDDPLVLADTIEQASSPLFHAGRIHLLAEWLEILPEQGFEEYPVLASLKGFIYTELGRPTEGIKIIKKSLLLNTHNKNKFHKAQSHLWLSTANRLIGNYEEALSNALTSYSLSANLKKSRRIKAESAREIGLAFARLGKSVESQLYLEESLRIYNEDGKLINSAQVRMDIGYLLLNIGKLSNAGNYFILAKKTWETNKNYSQLSLTMNNLGYLYLLQGDYPKASITIRQSFEYAESVSNSRLKAYALGSQGDLALAINNIREGIHLYEDGLAISEKISDGFLSVYFLISLSTCYRLLGELSNSQKYLGRVRKRITNIDTSNEAGLWRLENGFQYYQFNNIKEARKSFTFSRKIFAQSKKAYDTAKALWGLALCALADSRTDLLENHLEDLFDLVDQAETLSPLLPLLSRYQSQLELAAKELPALSNLKVLLEEVDRFRIALPQLQRELFPQENSPPGSGKLEIQALGGIAVRREGQRITVSEWVHQRTARELLFYLLDQPSGITKEQVGLVFWPDSSPAQLSCQFKNAIYRLRRALGRETILYNPATHSYHFNRDSDYEYDVEKFIELCRQAERESNPNRRMDLYRQAAAVYHHPFAPELDGVWAEPLRHQLYLDYESALLTLAIDLLGDLQFQDCLDICQELLILEPTNTEALELAMESLSNLERKTEIIRKYANYKRILYDEYGILPSKETQMIFERLSE